MIKENELKNFFKKIDFIEFVVLFGSYAKGKSFPISDFDLAIYTSKNLELLEIGDLISKLEKLTGLEVDLLILNDLYKNNPRLAYEIISQGKLIFYRNKNKWIEFKTWTYIYYCDHKPLFDMFDQAFLTRLKEGKFGLTK